MLRGALTRLISNKTLVVQDGVFDDSAALTLMSTDIDRIAVSLQNMNEVWARTLEVAIGIWLLAEQLGWIAVLPIVLIVGRLSSHVCTIKGSERLIFVLSLRYSQYTFGQIRQWQAEDLERRRAETYWSHCFYAELNQDHQDDGIVQSYV